MNRSMRLVLVLAKNGDGIIEEVKISSRLEDWA